MLTIAQVPQEKDLEIIMGGSTYLVSKFLFAAYCKKLQDRTVLETRYTVPEKFDPVIFRAFCDACQCQPYHVSDENAEELRRIAEFFECQSVIDDCNRLDTGPVGLISRAISAKGKGTEAHEEALKNVAENLSECLLSDKMLSLSDDQVVRIFELCDKPIDDATIVDFVLKYARRHTNAKVGNALKKVPLERLFKISAESLKELIHREQFPEWVSGQQVFKTLLPLLEGKRQFLTPPPAAARPVEPARPPQLSFNPADEWGKWQFLQIWTKPTSGLLRWYSMGQKKDLRSPAVFVHGSPNFNENNFKELYLQANGSYIQECDLDLPCYIEFELPHPVLVYGIVWSGTKEYRPHSVTIEVWTGNQSHSQSAKPSDAISDDRRPNLQRCYRVLTKESGTGPLFQTDQGPLPVSKIRFTQNTVWMKDGGKPEHNNLGLTSFEIHGIELETYKEWS